MESQMKGGPAPERPVIPNILIEATIKAIKDGMKPDEFSKAVAQTQEDLQAAQGIKIIKKKGQKEERKFKRPKNATVQQPGEEDAEPPRTYRNFDERRKGFLVIGDQHRFAGKYGKDRFIYASAPPLDYSFSMINRIEEIVTENEQPQKTRNYRFPEKTPDERYRTSSLRLSYNVILDMEGLVNVLYKILDGGPFGLCWLDISFNTIAKLDEDTLSQLPNLKILHLHGNAIVDMVEIPKLQLLKNMKTLTLHGNPIEQEDGYRIAVLYYLPEIQHLDYIAVTKSDKANSSQFGAKFESYWAERHGEFEARYQSNKKAAEISYTERVMRGGDTLSDDENEDNIKPIGY